MKIRDEAPRDRAAVRRVNELAFGQPAEAGLVEALHAADAVLVALVAEDGGEIVGHIAFSPVTIVDGGAGASGSSSAKLAGLAPMAVLPGLQSRGIGSALVRSGLDRCRALGLDGVVVLGHARYYPRFGFRAARELGLACEYDVEPEVFRALELSPGALRDVSGTVRYHPAFAAVS
jgi:putative acetyltransferase